VPRAAAGDERVPAAQPYGWRQQQQRREKPVWDDQVPQEASGAAHAAEVDADQLETADRRWPVAPEPDGKA